MTDADARDPAPLGSVVVVPVGDPLLLVDTLARLATQHVVVAAPAALASRAATAVTVAAGHRPDLRIARLASPHAPIAIGSALVMARATVDAPAIGLGLAEALLRHAWSGAWTSTVAKLTQPPPTIGQHVRSLLPGAGFLLRQAPDPAVLGSPRPDDVPAAGLDRMLLLESGKVPSAVAQRLAGAGRVADTRQVALPGSWTSVYGTDRAAQAALLPADPHALLHLPTHRCPVCGEDQLSPTCRFCRTLAVPSAPVGGHA